MKIAHLRKRKTMEENNFSVTIIIPTYNAEDHVKRVLSSVKNQSADNWKILLIDDGSEDRTVAFAKEYTGEDERISIIEKENGGVSSARNCGIKQLDTEWVLFLDADDELPIDALEKYAKKLENNSDIDFIAGGIEKISARKKVSFTFDLIEIVRDKRKNYALNVLNEIAYGTAWGKLFKTAIIKDNQLWFNENLSHAEDLVFVYQYLQHARCPEQIEDTIYHYYVNDFSATKRFNEKIPEAYLNALNELKNHINIEDVKELQMFYNCCLLHLLLITVNYVFHDQNPQSFAQKIKEYKQLLKKPVFLEALENAEMKYMKRSHKFVLILLKMHLYFGVYLCAKLRRLVR